MVVHKGTRIKIDGKESVVDSSWASGKHTQTKLRDGRMIVDLEISIANGDAQVIDATPVAPKKKVEDLRKRNPILRREIERTPREDEE